MSKWKIEWLDASPTKKAEIDRCIEYAKDWADEPDSQNHLLDECMKRGLRKGGGRRRSRNGPWDRPPEPLPPRSGM